MMAEPQQASDRSPGHWIGELDSLQNGPLAESMLLAQGSSAIPYLAAFLLQTPARTIAEPRCRAVRVLGALGAREVLLAYLREFELPSDPQVLFAEDAVRSRVGYELLQWQNEETFKTILSASERRATEGLIFALGEFSRKESVPILFRTLEDDLCRAAALQALKKIPELSRKYALDSLQGLQNLKTKGGNALVRCRATISLLQDIDVTIPDWRRIQPFLFEDDAEVVLSTAQIGLRVAPATEKVAVVRAIFRVADRFNWFQEYQATELLLENPTAAQHVASVIERERRARGEQPQWNQPFWRVLQHVLEGNVRGTHYGTA